MLERKRVSTVHSVQALEEKVFEDNEKFVDYETKYRSSWTQPATRKGVANTRFTNFQQGIARDRDRICNRPALRRVS